MLWTVDGFLRAINVTSEPGLYELDVIPDAPPDASDFHVRLPRDEALALVPLLGKKVRVTLTPKVEAR